MKKCQHCKTQLTEKGLCQICSKLPKCDSCAIIMCQSLNHLGKQAAENNKICEFCQIDKNNPVDIGEKEIVSYYWEEIAYQAHLI